MSSRQPKGAADFAREHLRLRQKPTVADTGPDPIKRAVEVQEHRAAVNIMTRGNAEDDLAALKLENERIKATQENEELQRQGREARDGSGVTVALLGEVKESRAEVAALQGKIADQQAAALRDRLNELAGQLESLRDASQQPSPSLIEVVTNEIGEARALIELVTPPTALAVPEGTEGANFTAWKHRFDAEREDAKWAREDRQAIAEQAATSEDSFREREVKAHEKYYEQLGHFFASGGPEIASAVGRITNWFLERQEVKASPAASNPGANGAVYQAPAPVGAMRMNCQACGGVITYKAGHLGVLCPYCMAEYQFTPDPPTEEDTPAETPSEAETLDG